MSKAIFRLLLGLGSAWLIIAMDTAQSAESLPAVNARQGIVLVIAQANASESSDCVGCVRTARATGFLINRYGNLVTSHHLLKQLGQYDPSTLKISIVYGDTLSSNPRPANIEFFDSERDVLTLKTPEHPDGFKFLSYSSHPRDQIQAGKTKVYTSGFPNGYQSHFTDSGLIKSFDGPPSHYFLWVTDMEFKEGQSGSPVYLEDGSVVGMVKGSEKDFSKNSFIVPINYVSRLTTFAHAGAASNDILSIVAKVASNEPQVREMKRSFFERNNHCANDRDIQWPVKADDGWRIDPTSISTAVDTVTANSNFTGVTDLGSAGFTLKGTLRNNGECVRMFDQVVAKDGRGWLGVSVTYKETKETEVVKSIPIFQGTVTPGSEVTQKLPPNTKDFTVFFRDSQGQVTTQAGAGNSGRVTVYNNVNDLVNGLRVTIQ